MRIFHARGSRVEDVLLPSEASLLREVVVALRLFPHVVVLHALAHRPGAHLGGRGRSATCTERVSRGSCVSPCFIGVEKQPHSHSRAPSPDPASSTPCPDYQTPPALLAKERSLHAPCTWDSPKRCKSQVFGKTLA